MKGFAYEIFNALGALVMIGLVYVFAVAMGG